MRCCAIGSIRWSELRSAGITSLSNSAACGPPRSARHCAQQDYRLKALWMSWSEHSLEGPQMAQYGGCAASAAGRAAAAFKR